jgi:PhoH-like ATPase
MKKIFVVDTNIILNDYMVPFSIRNAEVVIPQTVIHEVDRKQNFIDNKSAAYNARSFCRKIKSLIKKSDSCELETSPTSKIIFPPMNVEEVERDVKYLGLDTKADSAILATAWKLQQNHPDDEVIVVTNDANMWVTCYAIGLKVEEHESGKGPQDLYSGVRTIEFEDSTFIEDLYNGEEVFLTEEEYPNLYPNQILVLKSSLSRQSSAIAVFKGYHLPIKRAKDMKKMLFSGVRPLNKEQSFAYSLLEDLSVPCVTLAGRAGTGKSVITLSYGIERLGSGLDKIIILKPVIPVGKDLGFLPGSLEEKLLPWMESFKDSLDVIFKSDPSTSSKQSVKNGHDIVEEKSYQHLINSGMIEFHPLTFLRGRSIQNALIILDEAQNTSTHEIKTLLTRVGEGSKLVALGDIEQVDAPWLSQQNNGLAYLIERGRESELVAHITLIKSHRSALADWASSNL